MATATTSQSHTIVLSDNTTITASAIECLVYLQKDIFRCQHTITRMMEVSIRVIAENKDFRHKLNIDPKAETERIYNYKELLKQLYECIVDDDGSQVKDYVTPSLCDTIEGALR